MRRLKLHTPDFARANVAKLAELFPNCVTETRDEEGNLKRAIDFDLLKQELSADLVDGPRERYRLDWPGKREALALANAPIAKTLRPCREESVDFDTTKNLYIEGDNLDALKLLQESYLNRVKLIYIDPPYNTGNDFIYDDDFKESAREYFDRSNQVDEEGNRLVANTEANGRFHSDWLSMMYPRLRLARNLLRDDGVILISIDDHEVHNLRRVCDEVFGEMNFVGPFVWEKGRKNDAKLISVGHEYILVYARSMEYLRANGILWREEKPGAREIWDKYLQLRREHGDDDSAIERDIQRWFSSLPKSNPAKKWSRYRRIDKNGPWRDRDISWPGGGGPRYDVLHPKTGKPCKVPERGWIYATPEEMNRQIALGLVEFRDDHTEPPFRKAHIRPIDVSDGDDELASQVRGSYFYKQSQVSVRALRDLLGCKAFNNPKDHEEIARLIRYVTDPADESWVLDFYAGSSSTAHAALDLQSSDRPNLRFIQVQIPELIDEEDPAQRDARKLCDKLGVPHTIAEIGKERIRRAGAKIRKELEAKIDGELPGTDLHTEVTAKLAALDTGFRVLKVESSNMAEVFYRPDAVTREGLDLQVENIKPDRTPEDLLFQVLIDWGVDLALPIERLRLSPGRKEDGRGKKEEEGVSS